jgi:hypothetical protein
MEKKRGRKGGDPLFASVREKTQKTPPDAKKFFGGGAARGAGQQEKKWLGAGAKKPAMSAAL